MKKIITKIGYSVIVFLMLPHDGQAQFESIFGNNQTSWNVKTDQLFGSVVDSVVYDKEVLVNSEWYHKVDYYRADFFMHEIYVKEDIVSGKAWYSLPNNNTEYLIYNMSLNVGDSFLFNNETIFVDSVSFNVGLKHLYFNFMVNDKDEVFFEMIEGVGTNIGIAYHDQAVLGNINPVLLCQQKDNVPTYATSHPSYNSSCSIVDNVSSLSLNGHEINVYPNPVVDILMLDFIDVNYVTHVKLYDATGKEHDLNYEIGTKEVDVSHLHAGHYVLIFSSEYTQSQVNIIKK